MQNILITYIQYSTYAYLGMIPVMRIYIYILHKPMEHMWIIDNGMKRFFGYAVPPFVPFPLMMYINPH